MASARKSFALNPETGEVEEYVVLVMTNQEAQVVMASMMRTLWNYCRPAERVYHALLEEANVSTSITTLSSGEWRMSKKEFEDNRTWKEYKMAVEEAKKRI